jgi:hypothetical protein
MLKNITKSPRSVWTKFYKCIVPLWNTNSPLTPRLIVRHSPSSKNETNENVDLCAFITRIFCIECTRIAKNAFRNECTPFTFCLRLILTKCLHCFRAARDRWFVWQQTNTQPRMHNEVILHRMAAAQSILFSRNTRATDSAHDIKNVTNLNRW